MEQGWNGNWVIIQTKYISTEQYDIKTDTIVAYVTK